MRYVYEEDSLQKASEENCVREENPALMSSSHMHLVGQAPNFEISRLALG